MMGQSAQSSSRLLIVLGCVTVVVCIAALSRSTSCKGTQGPSHPVILAQQSVSARHQINNQLNASQIAVCNARIQELIEKGLPDSTANTGRQQALQKELDAWHTNHSSNIGEGHTGQVHRQQAWYMALAQIPCVRTVCEIGFNAGHSASVWMSAKDDLHLISFDIGWHLYSYTALHFYSARYPGRITATFGDSRLVVPKMTPMLGRVCDILVVDGAHSYEMAKIDIQNMEKLANPKWNVFIMDDTDCTGDWCLGPTKAIADAEAQGLISIKYRESLDAAMNVIPQEDVQSSVLRQPVRGFAWGQYNVNDTSKH